MIELPVRHGQWLSPRTARAGLAVASMALLVIFAVLTTSPPRVLALGDASGALIGPQGEVVAPSVLRTATVVDRTWRRAAGGPPPTAALGPDELPQVYVAGDSTAYALGAALSDWTSEHKDLGIWTAGWQACALTEGGLYRYAGQEGGPLPQCDWAERREAEIRMIQPHLVVVSYGTFDVLDRLAAGEETWRHIGDPVFDARLRTAMARLTDLLGARGARVVWLTLPHVAIGSLEDGTRPSPPFPESDPARVDRFNELLEEVVAVHPGAVVVDFAGFLRAQPGGELDPALRPDGVHVTPEHGDEVAAWLAPQLLALVGRPAP
jgi:lysophospholipase L1-like esterase